MIRRLFCSMARLAIFVTLGCGESAPSDPELEHSATQCVQFINATGGSNVVWTVRDKYDAPALQTVAGTAGSFTQPANIGLQAVKMLVSGYPPFTFTVGTIAGSGSCTISVPGEPLQLASQLWDVEANASRIQCRPHQPAVTLANGECR